jgi:hypothetical protein
MLTSGLLLLDVPSCVTPSMVTALPIVSLQVLQRAR